MEQALQTPSDILERVKQPSFRVVGAKATGGKERSLPDLPKLKATVVSHHRHQANPHFALDLLQDLQGQARQWVGELQRLQREIQGVYLDGPLIDGWLQSAATGKREAADKVLTPAEMKGGYALCGLDEYGKLWSKPCPVTEIPAVSLAIARYHRLKKLLAQKQQIEQKLERLVGSLEGLYEEYGLTAPTGSTGLPPTNSPR